MCFFLQLGLTRGCRCKGGGEVDLAKVWVLPGEYDKPKEEVVGEQGTGEEVVITSDHRF